MGPTAACGGLWCEGSSGNFGNQAGRALLLLAVRDFLAVDHHLAGCVDADPHLVAVDGQDCDFDVVSDVDDFADSARQNQNESCSRLVIVRSVTKARCYGAIGPLELFWDSRNARWFPNPFRIGRPAATGWSGRAAAKGGWEGLCECCGISLADFALIGCSGYNT
jgi:hypothetical protein